MLSVFGYIQTVLMILHDQCQFAFSSQDGFLWLQILVDVIVILGIRYIHFIQIESGF